jgi:glycosyltransferase involved in cell wall biosynthesis
VFLTSTMRTSFVDGDLAILRRHFDVDCYIGSGARAPFEVVRRALAADVSISWLASVYTAAMVAAARLRRRRTLVILGGVDTARDASIGYGIWRSRWRRPLLRWTLRNASRLLAVDPSLADALRASSGLTDLAVDVLPTGYDATFWTPGGTRERLVLCVAGASTRGRALVKGVDLFVETARRLPDVPFLLVGTDRALVASFDPPSNLTRLDAVPRERLRELYRQSSVLCLPSRHEGLPNALCEAMLCGAVPVAARAGGAADVIGECGYVVDRENVDALVGAVVLALDATDDLRARARDRIVERYPLELRERRLVEIIEELRHA